VHGTFTRADLTDATVHRLRRATDEGQRVLAGFDHQLGLPYGLARELGLDATDWRASLRAFVRGTYAPGAPPVGHPRDFAGRFNRDRLRRGCAPYFYSAIRAAAYGIPDRDPRRDEAGPDSTRFRWCERAASPHGRGTPKPLNRVGDNGSVGGQSLTGWLELVRLMDRCAEDGIRLRFWPFDGLDLSEPAYSHAHVFVEPYPAAVRRSDEAADDETDARAAARFVQSADVEDRLASVLEGPELTLEQERIVRFEGWIAGYPVRIPT